MKLSDSGKIGGEGRNRTYLPTRSVGATVLKTATTTRHASPSGETAGWKSRTEHAEFPKGGVQYIDLTDLRIASKSGKSPVRSLE